MATTQFFTSIRILKISLRGDFDSLSRSASREELSMSLDLVFDSGDSEGVPHGGLIGGDYGL